MTEEAKAELRFYVGFRSPYSRLGVWKLHNANLRDKVRIRTIPFAAPAGGAAFFDPLTSPPKAAYYLEDAPRMTKRLALTLTLPNPFEVSYSRANKSLLLAEQQGRGLAFAHAVSEARWGEGKDISSMDVLSECALAIGLSGELPREAKSHPEMTGWIESAKADIDTDQVFGVPFAVLDAGGGRQKFWGHDRFDLLLEIVEAL